VHKEEFKLKTCASKMIETQIW